MPCSMPDRGWFPVKSTPSTLREGAGLGPSGEEPGKGEGSAFTQGRTSCSSQTLLLVGHLHGGALLEGGSRGLRRKEGDTISEFKMRWFLGHRI